MLLNKNKILIAGVVGGVALAVPNMAKALYQCLPCPANSFAKKGTVGDLNSCVHIQNLKEDFFPKKYSVEIVGSCVSGYVKAGYPYRVRLAGGQGGKTIVDTVSPGNGAFLENNFVAPYSGRFILCAGKKGGDRVCGKNITGAGGQGSYLVIFGSNSIDEQIIFAAGGGGGAAFATVEATGGVGSCYYRTSHQIEEDGSQCSLYNASCGGAGGVGSSLFHEKVRSATSGKVLYNIGYTTFSNERHEGDGFAELYALE